MSIHRDTVPCVVFAFNRPDKLQRVLSALKTQDIERLIVFVDGPRDDADVELVGRCRAIARDVDWVDKELYIREQNRGLPGLSDSVSTVLTVYKAAVFVEDDCLPMPGFYSFMRRALSHYEPEKKVFSIGGYQPIPRKCFKNYPYSLVSSARFLCWGWAAWQDRWELIIPYLSKYSELFDGLRNVPDVAGQDLAGMARRCAQGRLRTWDVQVAISTLWLEQVHLLPTRGLVRNIDVGGGVHGESSRRRKHRHNKNVYEHSLENIVWLENVELNSDYADKLKQFVKGPDSSSTRRIKNRLRQLPFLVTLWQSFHHTKSKLRNRLFKPRPKRLYDLVLRQDESQPLTKRALLSYVVHPFSIARDDPRFLRNNNIWLAQEIVRILNQLGYVVDVVDYRDTSFVPRRKYDLFIGHGGHNFERIARNLPSHTVMTYLSTGIYWKEWNRREAERFHRLEQRRGVRLPYDRWITCSEEYANCSADAIICLGNEYTKESYSQFPLVLNLNNAAYPDDHYDRTSKDFVSAKNNFLFFSGGGNVHKGLDLLLEGFVGVDAHLHICQGISPKFHEVYRHELEDYPNIHLVGWIPVRSSRFYELVNKCAFVIHPSCAEGQPGSVVTCMHQGLIPVVSRETNIDTDDYGITLNTCSIEEITKVVQDLSQRSPDWVKELSLRTRATAVTDFSEFAFSRNMKKAIEFIARKKLMGTQNR